MAQVQIRCPNSGLWAPVGLRAEPDEWETMDVSPGPLSCGMCGEPHSWSKGDARLVDWAWG